MHLNLRRHTPTHMHTWCSSGTFCKVPQLHINFDPPKTVRNKGGTYEFFIFLKWGGETSVSAWDLLAAKTHRCRRQETILRAEICMSWWKRAYSKQVELLSNRVLVTPKCRELAWDQNTLSALDSRGRFSIKAVAPVFLASRKDTWRWSGKWNGDLLFIWSHCVFSCLPWFGNRPLDVLLLYLPLVHQGNVIVNEILIPNEARWAFNPCKERAGLQTSSCCLGLISFLELRWLMWTKLKTDF